MGIALRRVHLINGFDKVTASPSMAAAGKEVKDFNADEFAELLRRACREKIMAK